MKVYIGGRMFNKPIDLVEYLLSKMSMHDLRQFKKSIIKNSYQYCVIKAVHRTGRLTNRRQK